jgi:hypothetical protein
MVKLTPLNITLAVTLVWFISELNADNPFPFSWIWFLIFLIVISAVDIAFRIYFKNLKKIWFLQIGFILVVSLLMIILKLQ